MLRGELVLLLAALAGWLALAGWHFVQGVRLAAAEQGKRQGWSLR